MNSVETAPEEIASEYIDQANELFQRAGLSAAHIEDEASSSREARVANQLQATGADRLSDVEKHLVVGALGIWGGQRSVHVLAEALQQVEAVTTTIEASEPFAWLTSSGGHDYTTVTVAKAPDKEAITPERELLFGGQGQVFSAPINLALSGSAVNTRYLHPHYEMTPINPVRPFAVRLIDEHARPVMTADTARPYRKLLVGAAAINQYAATYEGKQRFLQIGISAEMLGDSSWFTAEAPENLNGENVVDELKEAVCSNAFNALVHGEKIGIYSPLAWGQAGLQAALRFAHIEKADLLAAITEKMEAHANDPQTSALGALAAKKAMDDAARMIENIYPPADDAA